jgi:hypothetical protein
MINQSAETNRSFLSAMMKPNAAEQPRQESTGFALELMRAMREWLPAPAPPAVAPPQTSIPEQLSTLKTLLELTRPAPAAPEQSILGELSGLVTSVLQTDAAARATTKAAEPPERRLPPPRAPRVVHVPGLGVVDVLQPEVPSLVQPARTEPSVDFEALRRDPVAVAKLLQALGITLPSLAASSMPSVPVGDPAPSPEPVRRAPTELTIEATSDAPKANPVSSAPPGEPHDGMRVSAVPVPAPEGAPARVGGVSALGAPPTPLPASVAVAAEVLRPAAPDSSSTSTRSAIALPERMPMPDFPPDPEASAAAPRACAQEQQGAAESLGKLSTLPPDELRAKLRTIPGLALHADDLAVAIADLPPQAIAMVVGRLPAEHVRELSALRNGKGG